MKATTLFLLLIMCCPSQAQTNAQEHYQYDSIYKTMLGYYHRGLYHQAAQCPEALEENKYVNASTNFFFARIYALGNEWNNALFCLEKAVKQGIGKTQIEQTYDLDEFRKKKQHIIFSLNYEQWHQEFLEQEQSIVIDSLYQQQLNAVNKQFSASREKRWKKEWVNGDVIYAFNNQEDEALQQEEDSLYYEMVELILGNGFPTKKRVGSSFYKVSRNLTKHIPDDYNLRNTAWKNVQQLIAEEMAQGNLLPFYAALMEDRIRMQRKQPTLYGAARLTSSSYENPSLLNVRRKAVGLCSIQLEVWSKARELPAALKTIEMK